MSDMTKYMANPRAYTLKRWMYELIKEKYSKHDTIVERVSTSLVTDKDLQDFGALVTEVFEYAYRKAVSDCTAQFEQLGVKVSVVADKTP